MRTTMKKTKIVDLTPLLDVFIILLFALLFNMSVESEASEEKADVLSEAVEEMEEILENLEVDNEQLQEENKSLKEDVTTVSKQYSKSIEAIKEWMTLEEIVDDSTITQEMIEEVFDKDKSKQMIYELEFIANQFYFIEIQVDTYNKHQVLINGNNTYIYLDKDIHNDQEALNNSKDRLFNLLEEYMNEAESGYNNILFTLKDDGTTIAKSFNVIWDILNDIELKYGTDEIYKVKYLTY